MVFSVIHMHVFVVQFLSDDSHVLSIRDTESVKKLQQKLKGARRTVVVGNGGIATELV